jgi:hypothetical protein
VPATLIYLLYLAPHLLILPALAWVWNGRKRTRQTARWRATSALLWWGVLKLGVPWFYPTVHMPWLYLLLLIGVAVYALAKSHKSPITPGIRYGYLALSFALTVGLAWITTGRFTPSGAIDIAPPFRNGTYYIMQGGNHPLLNPFHNRKGHQSYALDIVKLDRWGRRAKGMLPANPGKYELFGDTIFSPVAGEVLRAFGDMADQKPPVRKFDPAIGNHVLIAFGGYRLAVGHLKQGQVFVQPGQHITEGTPLGLAGNTGNTIEPHLHIQVALPTDSGWTAVPFTLGGKYYAVGDVVKW